MAVSTVDWQEYKRRLNLKRQREHQVRMRAGWSAEPSNTWSMEAILSYSNALRATRKVLDYADI